MDQVTQNKMEKAVEIHKNIPPTNCDNENKRE